MSKGSKGQKKKKSSVLARQKPTKSKKKVRTSYFKRTFFVACAFAIPILGFGAFWTFQQANHWVDQWLNEPVSWRISLNIDGNKPLPAEEAKEILAIASKELGSGNRRDMLRAAREIQAYSSFAKVHFVKLSQSEMVLYVERREPILCVMADRLRFVTRGGQVYGAAKQFGQNDTDCPGPVLTGIFSEDSNLRKRQDQTLSLDHDHQLALDEAIDLYLHLKPMDLHVTEIHFEKVRGFSVHSQASDEQKTTISLGRAPFPPKLAKLREIRSGLAEKGDIAERIELDYQGKAFIKLRKM